MPSPTIQDQAHMKLGRLVHSYQKFEALLKAVVARSNTFGKADEFEENFRAFQSATSGQTLGSITNRLFDTIYGPPKEVPEPTNLDKPFFAIEMRTVIKDPEILNRERRKFQAVVVDRNTLIHSTLASLNLESETDCQVLIDELDRQHEQLIPLYEEIRDQLKEFIQFAQAIAKNPELFDSNAKPPETVVIGDHAYTKDSTNSL